MSGIVEDQLSKNVSNAMFVTGIDAFLSFVGALNFDVSKKIHFQNERFIHQAKFRFLIVLVTEKFLFELLDGTAVERQKTRVNGNELIQNHRRRLNLFEDLVQIICTLIETNSIGEQMIPQTREIKAKEIVDDHLREFRSLIVDDRQKGVQEDLMQLLERIVEQKRIVEKDEQNFQGQRNVLAEITRPILIGLLIPFGDFSCFQTLDHQSDDFVELIVREKFLQDEFDQRR